MGKLFFNAIATLIILASGNMQAMAASQEAQVKELKSKVESLEAELGEMKARLDQLLQADSPESKVAELEDRLNDVEIQQQEWESSDSSVHLAGYAAAGYTNRENEVDSFGGLNFNPIFHYQYKDFLLFESELEFEIAEDGETEVALEYASIDLLFSDYATLLAGKFQSPLGQFRQNIHPAWINKFPSAPPGFGHDGAAPTAEVGLQLRGGFKTEGATRFNYAAYVGNGPELELNPSGDEIEAVGTEGFTSNADDNPAYGGRVAVLPIPSLELGVSGATSRVALDGERDRSYSVLGADFWWQWMQYQMRGEYVRQEVGSESLSVAPEGQEWESWYVQGSYRLPSMPWEGVVRYSDFESTHDDQSQEQWGVGVNYLFASNVIWKLAYEFNDGLTGTSNDSDRFLTQITYGF